MDVVIRGAGGKGGGGSARSPIEYADSLRSTQVVRIIDVVSEGVIAGFPESGPVDPDHADPTDPAYAGDLSAKYIYLNDTPLMNEDNTFNFSDVAYTLRYGTQDQAHVGGFVGSENVISVGVELKVSTGAFVRAVTDASINAVIVTMEYPRLTQQTSEGDLTGASVGIQIEVQPNGEAYRVMVDPTTDGYVSGKSVGQYTRSWYIPLPGTAPWNIRITRDTADSGSATLENKTYVQSMTEVIETKLRYPNTAYVAMRADARQFGAVPNRSYLLKGIKVLVPSNYDPVTRVYTGIWDGTFQLAWTNNPAWVWYDLLTSDRYGLGALVDPDMVDKFTCYQIGKYCDEMVDDGLGGTEPRFTCNLFLMTQEEAYTVISNLASVFRGMSYWAAGAFTLVADQPKDPVAIFTNANTLENGDFEYSGSARKTRHNAVQVSWNNPNDNYKLDWVYEEDSDSISRIGLRQTEFAALGCTSKRQAIHAARAMLYTERWESSLLTFSTGLEGAKLRPGDIFEVHDNMKSGVERGGRLAVGSTGTTIELDRPVTYAVGSEILVQLGDGFVEAREITAGSGTSTLTIASAFSEDPAANSVFIVRPPASALYYRVLAVKETKINNFTVSAIRHDPNKYDYIEGATNITADDPVTTYSGIPTGLILREDSRTMSTGEVLSIITADWTPVTNASNYVVAWRKDNGNWMQVPDQASTTYEIPEAGVVGSTYTVRVSSVVDGRTSRGALGSIVCLGKQDEPQNVSGFVAEPGLYTSELYWSANDPSVDPDLVGYEIRVGASWAAGTVVVKDYPGTKFTWQKQPTSSYDLWIKAKNTSGLYSITATAVTLDISPSDDFITPSEKRSWKVEFDVIHAEQTTLDTNADLLGISHTSYDTAITNLDAYLDTLVGAEGWTGGGTDNWTSYDNPYYLGDATPASTGAAFVAAFKNVYTARNALQQAIVAAQADQVYDATRVSWLWEFDGATLPAGVTNSGHTVSSTDSGTTTQFVSTGANDYLEFDLSSLNLSFNGRQARLIFARVYLPGAIGDWDGDAFFQGTSPAVGSYSSSNHKVIAAPGIGKWRTVVWDMSALTVGGTNYISNTGITKFRLDLLGSAGKTIKVDMVGIGYYGAGSKYDQDNALYASVIGALNYADTTRLGSTVVTNRGNLIPNPQSEYTSTILPTGSIGLVGIDSTGLGYNGSSGSRKILAGITSTITNRTACRAGDSYYFTAQAAQSGGGVAHVIAEAFDKDGVSLGDFFDQTVSGTSYTLISAQGTIPANAVSFIVKLKCVGGTYAKFDELGCLQCADAFLLVNGSIQGIHIAGSTIQTYHLTVGPQYQFKSTAGGQPLMLNNDGTFSANTYGTENATDKAVYMDDSRIWPSTKIKTFEANFTGAENRGFLINMGSAFATSAQNALRIRHTTTGAVQVHSSTGLGSYTLVKETTGLSAPSATAPDKLTAVYLDTAGTSATRRLIVKLNGVEVVVCSDAELGASYNGQRSGYAGILLGDHATRPSAVRVWGVAMGTGFVTLQDGVVQAETLAADMAILTIIRSPNYVAGSTGVAPTGFKMSGNTFTTTYYDGTTGATNMEIGTAINIGGEKVGAVINRSKGNSILYSTGATTWVCPEGITSVEITLQAAGGNGGNSYGGGGGAGQYIRKYVTVVPGVTYTITIGAVGSNSTMTGSGFTTITAICGSNGNASTGGNGSGGLAGAGADTNGDGFATVSEIPEDGWSQHGASGGGPSSGVGIASGRGGDCGPFTGGAEHTYLTGKPVGGGGGASATANGGDGNIAVVGANGTAGTSGSGGGGGNAGGAGGPGWGRIRY